MHIYYIARLGSEVRTNAGCQADVDRVIMVGGSSSIPELQIRLAEYFGKNQDEIFNAVVNPDTAIAAGAAILGASLQGSMVRQYRHQGMHVCFLHPMHTFILVLLMPTNSR